ncbi:MAG: pyridoxamine 5'-phosphate oxidase family protein [Actinomycetota bacterium]
MSVSLFTDTDALESCVGKRPSGSHLKSISYLDEHCRTLLAASPFSVLGVASTAEQMRTIAVGGAPGVLAPSGRSEVALPALAGHDLPEGTAVGVLSFVPGYRETLRMNGRLRYDDGPTLVVEEAFLHCAKALIRSSFWVQPEPDPPGGEPAEGPTDLSRPEVHTFLHSCPFVVLSSVDGQGCADVSPKGDPAGLVARVVDGNTLAVADRPGNRRTDTMHNLIDNDVIGVLAMIPGSERVLEVRGRAGVTADEAVRTVLTANDKLPTAAIVVSADEVEFRQEPAIAAAGLWDVERHLDPASLPKPTRIWVDHVKRNDDPGLAAKAARRAVNARMLERSIDKDYRENLY